jgi:hypothetical protein
MNNIWSKIIVFSLLLILVLAPFAGFAPLLLIVLIAGTFWFLGSIFQILVFGQSNNQERDTARD